jgi:hypothetical protein
MLRFAPSSVGWVAWVRWGRSRGRQREDHGERSAAERLVRPDARRQGPRGAETGCPSLRHAPTGLKRRARPSWFARKHPMAARKYARLTLPYIPVGVIEPGHQRDDADTPSFMTKPRKPRRPRSHNNTVGRSVAQDRYVAGRAPVMHSKRRSVVTGGAGRAPVSITRRRAGVRGHRSARRLGGCARLTSAYWGRSLGRERKRTERCTVEPRRRSPA